MMIRDTWSQLSLEKKVANVSPSWQCLYLPSLSFKELISTKRVPVHD